MSVRRPWPTPSLPAPILYGRSRADGEMSPRRRARLPAIVAVALIVHRWLQITFTLRPRARADLDRWWAAVSAPSRGGAGEGRKLRTRVKTLVGVITGSISQWSTPPSGLAESPAPVTASHSGSLSKDDFATVISDVGVLLSNLGEPSSAAPTE